MATFAGNLAGTSLQAIGRSLATGAANVQVLDDGLVLGVFRQLHSKRRELVEAGPVLAEVETALRQDELQRPLAKLLRQTASEAQAVLERVVVVEPPEPPPVPAAAAGVIVLVSEARRARGSKDVLATIGVLEAMLTRLRSAAQTAPGDSLELAVQVELRGRKG